MAITQHNDSDIFSYISKFCFKSKKGCAIILFDNTTHINIIFNDCYWDFSHIYLKIIILLNTLDNLAQTSDHPILMIRLGCLILIENNTSLLSRILQIVVLTEVPRILNQKKKLNRL